MATVAELMVKISANTRNFHRNLATVESELSALEGHANDVGGSLVNAFKAVSPAIAPIGAVAVGTAGAVVSSFGVAGGAIAGFGALAVTTLNDVFEASEDVQKINEKIAEAKAMGDMEKVNALMEERAFVMSQLSKEQQRASTALSEFQSFWSSFAGEFEKPVVDIFVKSLEGLETVITELEPMFRGSLGAINGLMDSFLNSLNTPQVQAFFNYLNTSAGPTLTTLGQVFGNVFQGIMNLMVAFGPLANEMNGGLLSLTQRFAQWSAGLSENQSFQNFINYVRTNGPVLLSVLGQVVMVLFNVLQALAPMGAVMLQVIQNMLAFTNSIIQNHPWVVQLMAGILQLTGVIRLMFPVLTLLRSRIGQLGITFAKTLGKMAIQATKSVAKIVGRMVFMAGRYAWLGAKALVHAAKVAASWVIAMGPVGWVTALVIGLVALIIANWETVKKWTAKIWDSISGGIADAWDWLIGKASSVWSAIKDHIIDPIMDAKDTVMGIIDTIVGAFKGMKIKIPDFNLPHISVDIKWGGPGDVIPYPDFDVNWYASGGIFNGASVIGVGESGPEAVVPLSGSRMRPFAKAIAEEMGGMVGGRNGMSNQPMIIRLELGSQELEVFVEDITEIQDRQTYRAERFSG